MILDSICNGQATTIFFNPCLLINPNTRDIGVKAIENLMKKKGKFDYVLLETTGLADPGPIASIFWMDEQLCSDLYLDGMFDRKI